MTPLLWALVGAGALSLALALFAYVYTLPPECVIRGYVKDDDGHSM